MWESLLFALSWYKLTCFHFVFHGFQQRNSNVHFVLFFEQSTILTWETVGLKIIIWKGIYIKEKIMSHQKGKCMWQKVCKCSTIVIVQCSWSLWILFLFFFNYSSICLKVWNRKPMHRKMDHDRSFVSWTYLQQNNKKICTTDHSACNDRLLGVTGAMVPTNAAKCHPSKPTHQRIKALW